MDSWPQQELISLSNSKTRQFLHLFGQLVFCLTKLIWVSRVTSTFNLYARIAPIIRARTCCRVSRYIHVCMYKHIGYIYIYTVLCFYQTSINNTNILFAFQSIARIPERLSTVACFSSATWACTITGLMYAGCGITDRSHSSANVATYSSTTLLPELPASTAPGALAYSRIVCRVSIKYSYGL